MFFADALTLDAPRRTSDGYLAVRARSARTGVYQYTGREVDPDNSQGLRDKAVVNVLRDENTVFDRKAAQSFVGKPVTDNHPRESVTAANWRDHARGTVMGALRDGEYLVFDLLLTDAAAISKVDGGKRELSNGYGAELEFGSFTAKDGTVCDARQSRITGGNHVALVDRGRAGSECAIADAATCDSIPLPNLTEKPVKTMLIDGLTVDIANADTAHATITTILAARDTAAGKVTDLETKVATLTTDKATLETENKQLKDSKPTPAQLRDAAKQFAIVVDKAKSLGVTVTDEMDEGAIIKAAVGKHVADTKDWTDAMFAASFATLKAAATTQRINPLDAAIAGSRTGFTDAASIRDAARVASLN